MQQELQSGPAHSKFVRSHVSCKKVWGLSLH